MIYVYIYLIITFVFFIGVSIYDSLQDTMTLKRWIVNGVLGLIWPLGVNFFFFATILNILDTFVGDE